MRRLRPLFYLNEDLAAPPELDGVEASAHERLVQDALRATRRTWQLVVLRTALWLVNGCALLAAGWLVFELIGWRSLSSGSPGPAALLFLLLLPLFELFRWRGQGSEERLFRCALRETVWREQVVPTTCFDCGADLHAPQSRAGGPCHGCGAALLRTEEVVAPRLERRWPADPFHRGLKHAVELRHLQRGERRRLAEEAMAAARRAPIVRTLNRVGLIAWILSVFVVLARWILPRSLLGPGFSLIFLAALGSILGADTLAKRQARSHLRLGLLLTRRLPASCFRCQANLAGVTASRCPGCGAMLLPE